jgi:hypothetical protein
LRVSQLGGRNRIGTRSITSTSNVPQVGHQHTDGLGPDIVDNDAARRPR